MSKICYANVNNVAKKSKYIYASINGVAKKVKKGYISVDGKAKLFYSLGYTISIGDHPNCSITLSYTVDNKEIKSTNSNMYDVPEGTKVTMVVKANDGYSVSSTTPSTSTFTVTSDMEVKASTSKNTYTVTLNATDGADVTITSDIKTSDGKTSVTNSSMNGVYYNSTITVTATAKDGYTVDSISID